MHRHIRCHVYITDKLSDTGIGTGTGAETEIETETETQTDGDGDKRPGQRERKGEREKRASERAREKERRDDVGRADAGEQITSSGELAPGAASAIKAGLKTMFLTCEKALVTELEALSGLEFDGCNQRQ